ncbi:32639_t:CDS:2 [Gigaspora margarita]|uniref:32639_t:CDS:1 n=1 Tax=Gigaspora margarita TaxID=4874 RepID=A0ABN7WJ00_GIGMA|nr:32639_t:CDS:2 [Gigaspora margarita]
MFCLDNSQAVGETQLHLSAPLLPPFTDESDIPEFFQCSKEKYESQKMGCGRWRKTSRDELFNNSSLDGDYDDDTSSADFRCQTHNQSERKRCAEIKDSFEKLRKQLPTTYTGHRMCKAILLQKGDYNFYIIITNTEAYNSQSSLQLLSTF